MARRQSAAEKQKAAAAALAPKLPPRWPTLEQYAKGVGAFRPRQIKWSTLSSFALSPYTMGIFSCYCATHKNFSNLIAGGAADISAPFSPPEPMKEIFREAYRIVNAKGSWITWGKTNKGDSNWITYNITNLKSFSIFNDSDLDPWEKHLTNLLPEFEDMHKALSRLGVPEPKIITVPFDKFMEMSNEEAMQVIDGATERMRIGIV